MIVVSGDESWRLRHLPQSGECGKDGKLGCFGIHGNRMGQQKTQTTFSEADADGSTQHPGEKHREWIFFGCHDDFWPGIAKTLHCFEKGRKVHDPGTRAEANRKLKDLVAFRYQFGYLSPFGTDD